MEFKLRIIISQIHQFLRMLEVDINALRGTVDKTMTIAAPGIYRVSETLKLAFAVDPNHSLLSNWILTDNDISMTPGSSIRSSSRTKYSLSPRTPDRIEN